MKICDVEGCGRRAHCAGLCQTHYVRASAGRPLEAPIGPPRGHARGNTLLSEKKAGKGLCRAPCDPPCGRAAVDGTFCAGHLRRLRHGKGLATRIREREVYGLEDLCAAPCDPPCDRPAAVHGLCRAHYLRERAGKDLGTAIGSRGRPRKKEEGK